MKRKKLTYRRLIKMSRRRQKISVFHHIRDRLKALVGKPADEEQINKVLDQAFSELNPRPIIRGVRSVIDDHGTARLVMDVEFR